MRRSLRAVCEDAYAYLETRSAVDGVRFAVRRLEDDPLFNAGTGSVLQRDGKARMSASIMDGALRRFSAVLNIEGVRHPVDVASALQGEEDRVLAGSGAVRFAREQGIAPWNSVTPVRLHQWQRRVRDRSAQGTVGAIALDVDGRLAAATSTGGKGFERVGRVSDSGLPVGNYADDQVAVSCTGLGEEIVDEALAVRIAQRVADGRSLAQALALTFRELRARERRVGAIGLDRRGRWAASTTLPVLFAVTRTPARMTETF